MNKQLELLSLPEEATGSEMALESVKKAVEAYSLSYPEWKIRHFAYVIENGSEEDLKSLPVMVKRAWEHYCKQIEGETEAQKHENVLKQEAYKHKNQTELEKLKGNKNLRNMAVAAILGTMALLCNRYLVNDPMVQQVVQWILGGQPPTK